MPESADTKIPARVLPFLLVVMFLFGGTAGYIVRDVRADVQVLRVANDARESAQALATEVLRHGEVAAGAVTTGMRAAAESTAAAIERLADKDGAADSTAPTVLRPNESLSTRSAGPAAAEPPTRAKQ